MPSKATPSKLFQYGGQYYFSIIDAKLVRFPQLLWIFSRVSKGTDQEASDHFGDSLVYFCAFVWLLGAWIKEEEEEEEE